MLCEQQQKAVLMPVIPPTLCFSHLDRVKADSFRTVVGSWLLWQFERRVC